MGSKPEKAISATSVQFPRLALPDLEAELAELIQQIPSGKITTAGDLATALGSTFANRWVGQFCAAADPAALLIHRVVLATGKLKSPTAAEALEREGIAVSGDRVDVDRFRWNDFETTQPLRKLLDEQVELSRRIDLTPLAQPPMWVGGVDVSYPDPANAVAAYTLVRWPEPEIIWSKTVRFPVPFPYITSFLSYRELPIYLELLEQVWQCGRNCDLLMVDGSGILHPRKLGIAAHLGVWTGIPTLGVTKTYLTGEVDLEGIGDEEDRAVLVDGETLGYAFRPSASKRPLFVSPGHRVGIAESIHYARRLVSGHRLPEPLYWADRFSRDASG